MPFALWGLNRFVTAGSRSGLIAGAGALVMQNWSCGYYLLYFAPFAPLFILHRMWTVGTWRSARTWGGLLVAAAVTLGLTLPFLLPYSAAQNMFGFERTFGEVVLYSANVWSYVTASENLRLWGHALRYFPHGEGETFLGFIPWFLAAVALVALLWPSAEERSSAPPAARWRTYVAAFLLFAVVTQLIAVMSVVLFGGFDLKFLGVMISARTPQRLLMQFIVSLALLLVLSPRARVESLRIARSPIFLALALTVLAMWLSLGPIPKAGDSLVSGFGLYNVLYDYVPGFNGVRAPARYAMIAGMYLAVLAGYGMQRGLAHIAPFTRALAVIVCGALILVEGAAIPMEINRAWNQNEAMPPSQVFPYRQAPAVYQRVAALPQGSAISEFPYGDAAWEIRYVYYSAAHGKPITNGYSGNFPPRYKERVARLMRVGTNPAAAWASLRESRTTHVIVHRNAFATSTDADTVEAWLKANGATELERFADGDILLSVN